MIDVEKQIEEVMRKVEFMRGAAQFGSPCALDAARNDVEATIRTLLSSAQSGERDIEAAAKKLAELTDYPWEFMPEQGRAKMREDAAAIIAASQPNGEAA